MTKRSIIAERLRQTRKAKGLSQIAMAERLDTTQDVIMSWETDRHLPTLISLLKIVEELEVSADWLLGLKR